MRELREKGSNLLCYLCLWTKEVLPFGPGVTLGEPHIVFGASFLNLQDLNSKILRG